VEDVVTTVNRTIRQVNKIVDWVQHNYITIQQQVNDEPWAQKYSALLEYFFIFIVLTLTVSTSLDFIGIAGFQWKQVLVVAFALSTTLLVGALKQLIANKIKQKTSKIDSLEQQAKAQDTALSSMSMQVVEMNNQFHILYDYVKQTDPNFDFSKLYLRKMSLPDKVGMLDLRGCEDTIKKHKEQKNKNSSSTL